MDFRRRNAGSVSWVWDSNWAAVWSLPWNARMRGEGEREGLCGMESRYVRSPPAEGTEMVRGADSPPGVGESGG